MADYICKVLSSLPRRQPGIDWPQAWEVDLKLSTFLGALPRYGCSEDVKTLGDYSAA